MAESKLPFVGPARRISNRWTSATRDVISFNSTAMKNRAHFAPPLPLPNSISSAVDFHRVPPLLALDLVKSNFIWLSTNSYEEIWSRFITKPPGMDILQLQTNNDKNELIKWKASWVSVGLVKVTGTDALIWKEDKPAIYLKPFDHYANKVWSILSSQPSFGLPVF